MHPAVTDWVEHVRAKHYWHFGLEEHPSLDAGSLDINGCNRGFFQSPSTVIGVDLQHGKNVDMVSLLHELTFRDGYFTTIISTEAMEHDAYLPLTLRNLVRMLASGGLFVFTCATTGREEHGTIVSKPHDSPGLPWWHYRNVTEEHVRLMIDVDGIFSSYEFNVLGEDLRFFGIRK